jgi:ADP-ribose pyrophosphatase
MGLKWKKIKERKVKVGYRTIVISTFRLPDGKIKDFHLIRFGKSVCTLALTPDKKVILVRQFRPGPQRIVSEIPGGGLEKGESAKTAAKRELLEETGYTGDFKLVGKSLDDAYSTKIRYHFVALNCKKVKEPKYDKSEFGEVIKITLKDFRKHLRSGMLTDLETGYLCLDFLGLL